MRLSDYAVGKDNNFTLLRLIAAIAVVFTHSVAVLGIAWNADFFVSHFGRSIGEMCLDMLFVTSGFLVTASLLTRPDLVEFFWARALRLYPALWLMLGVTVFLLAPCVTTLSPEAFFSSGETWNYLRKSGSVLGGIRYSLPGVFDAMPLKGEFNGSLWTLPVEARMYFYLAATWLAFALWPGRRRQAIRFLAPFIAVAYGAMVARVRLTGGAFSGPDIAIFMWLYGSALYYWRDKIPTSWSVLAGLAAVLAAASFDKRVAFVAYLICWAPIVLHLAYLPGGFVRRFAKSGDYSYGVYIYAFPAQQSLAFLFPKISLINLLLGSAAIAFTAAGLSWHLLEKRALGMKHKCAAVTERCWGAVVARLGAMVRADSVLASLRLPLFRNTAETEQETTRAAE